MRQGYISILNFYPDYLIIGEVSNGVELLDLLQANRADIILLDIEMPLMTGTEALEKISILYPEIRVIIVSMHYSPLFVAHFFLKGARAYLPKDCDPDELVKAIDFVVKDGYYLDTLISRQLVLELINGKKSKELMEQVKLNERELHTLKLICDEKTNKEIAKELEISLHTVDYYRRKILLKTNQSSLVGLVKYAIKNGIDFLN